MWSTIVCDSDEAQQKQLIIQKNYLAFQSGFWNAGVPFFCIKPVTCKKMEQTLKQFM